jgi:hypothetical protein
MFREASILQAHGHITDMDRPLSFEQDARLSILPGKHGE